MININIFIFSSSWFPSILLILMNHHPADIVMILNNGPHYNHIVTPSLSEWFAKSYDCNGNVYLVMIVRWYRYIPDNHDSLQSNHHIHMIACMMCEWYSHDCTILYWMMIPTYDDFQKPAKSIQNHSHSENVGVSWWI